MKKEKKKKQKESIAKKVQWKRDYNIVVFREKWKHRKNYHFMTKEQINTFLQNLLTFISGVTKRFLKKLKINYYINHGSNPIAGWRQSVLSCKIYVCFLWCLKLDS